MGSHQLKTVNSSWTEKMSKAIFSLFCVAALFNSGLVSGNALGLDKAKLTEYCTKWTEGAGDAAGNLGTFLGDLTEKGIGELNKLSGADDGSVGDQIADFFGTVLKKGLEAVGDLGDSQLSKVCAKVGLGDKKNPTPNPDPNPNPNPNPNPTPNPNSDNGQVNHAGLPGSQTGTGNGGNTVQIPTIFFLILAIFNH